LIFAGCPFKKEIKIKIPPCKIHVSTHKKGAQFVGVLK